MAVLTDRDGAQQLAATAGLPIVWSSPPRDALGAVSAWIYRTAEHPAAPVRR